MKQTIKIMVLIGLFTVAGNKVYSQMSVAYYASSFSKVGLSYYFSERVRAELRVYSNTSFEDLTPELVFCYNFVNAERYNIYAGAGVVANYYNGIVIPFGVQFTPFEKNDKFSLHIELQPTFDFDYSPLLQSSWGIKYRF